jgi:hypothetical protein
MKNKILVLVLLFLLSVDAVAQIEPSEDLLDILKGIGNSCKSAGGQCNLRFDQIKEKLDQAVIRMRDNVQREIFHSMNRFIYVIVFEILGLWCITQFLAMYSRFRFEKAYRQNYDIMLRTVNDLEQVEKVIKDFRAEFGLDFREEVEFYKKRSFIQRMLGVKPRKTKKIVHHIAETVKTEKLEKKIAKLDKERRQFRDQLREERLRRNKK